ncbi:uracil-DNA glycosylase [Sandaracinobacteroides saxicola]|uniref:Uracil-DNA glycosylase n=1 Tax=Sandaracinobacteroides saxicola TaxID=2759707 RepID=A0A7G5IGB9_9SPHN|nr:uracil-DNA glycosylase [Sandaracinobacteroides saxicola]QMW22411.1 uracil-DNA glycosylase [Sandaracinobacteroides saxicola]
MSGGVSSHANDRAALAFWLESGVDMLVDPLPRRWLAPVVKASPQPCAEPAPPPPALASSKAWDRFTTLADLTAAVGTIPFADGNPAAGVMVLGDGPSAEDLRTGRPFSGPAGELLDRMLAAIGLDRGGAYIALLCPRRSIPTAPGPEDIARDLPLTRAHIRLAAPRVLLLLGQSPSGALFGERGPISSLRGQWRDLDIEGHRVAALASFNPGYLLRNPLAKREAWADLRALGARIAA